jgi:hypothetical protein
LPLPVIDRAQLRQVEAAEVARAKTVENGSLTNEVRAVGEQVRRIGAALAAPISPDPRLVEQVQLDANSLAQKSPDALLALRALQAELFLQAVRAWETSHEVSQELRELGGPFSALAQSAWLDEAGHLTLEPDELRLLFRIHFGRLTGLHGLPPFGPSLEESRRYYGTHLRHPLAPRGDPVAQSLAQLPFAAALGNIDPEYPAALAVGILLLRAGDPLSAAPQLETYLRAQPNGPWSQVAQNSQLLAIRQSNAEADSAP